MRLDEEEKFLKLIKLNESPVEAEVKTRTYKPLFKKVVKAIIFVNKLKSMLTDEVDPSPLKNEALKP